MDTISSDSGSYDGSGDEGCYNNEESKTIDTSLPAIEQPCTSIAENNLEARPFDRFKQGGKYKQQPVIAYTKHKNSSNGGSTGDNSESAVTIFVDRQNTTISKPPINSERFNDAYDIVDKREADIMNDNLSSSPKRTASFTDSLRQAFRSSRFFGNDQQSANSGTAQRNPTGRTTPMASVAGSKSSSDAASKRPQMSAPRGITGQRSDSRESSFELISGVSNESPKVKRTGKILPQIPSSAVDGSGHVQRSKSFPVKLSSPTTSIAGETESKQGKQGNRYSSASQYGIGDEVFKSIIPMDSFKRKKTQVISKEMTPSKEKLSLLTDCYPPYFADFPADRRSLIALELYTTERSYVKGLEIVVDLFKRSLASSVFFDTKEINIVFSNIEDILNMNLAILGDLATRLDNWSDDQIISDIFTSREENFKLYASYCKSYDAGEALLKHKLRKKKDFEAFMQSCYANPSCQPGLTLPSYLITAVQRIPRYILLLKDLLRKTPSNHKDIKGLYDAVALMEKLADYINEQLKHSQSQNALEALQFQIAGLKAYYMSGRVLIHEGAVSMMNIKKTYQCVLFNDLLVLAVKGSAKSEVELVLDLNLVWFEDDEDLDPQTTRQDAIAIYTPDRPYTIYVGSNAEKKLWLTHLRKSIVKNLYGADAKVENHDIEKRNASHTYKHGSVYSGEFLMAKRHGTGMMMWPNQMTYKGEWLDDERNGIGSVSFSNGEVYEGEWLDNAENGKAIMKYPNGDQIIGQWKRGSRHGNAEIKFSNGDTLNCVFVNDKIDGHGKLVCENGITYEGEWKRNMRHGEGKERCADGHYYVGEFRYDKPQGKGTRTYRDGSTYVGDFDGGECHGEGKFVAKSGQTYQGSWFRGYMEGRGKMVYSNGDTYEGTWIKNMRYGHGTFTCANGDVYVGQWERDQYSGSGVLTLADGSSYDGKWSMGARHGFGKQCNVDKSVYEGFWADGLYHGKGTLTKSNGCIYSGQWMHGKLEGIGSLSIEKNKYLYEGSWKCGMRDGRGIEHKANVTFEGEFRCDKREGKGVESVADQMTFEGSWKRGLRHGRGVLRLFNGVAQQQLWNSGSLVESAAATARELPYISRQ